MDTERARPAASRGRGRRDFHSRRAVRFSDRLASLLITVGGVGTIVAVLLVCVLLAWVVVPLFRSAQLAPPVTLKAPWAGHQPVQMGIDEYRSLAWTLTDDGWLWVFRPDQAELLEQHRVCDSARIAAISPGPQASQLALGLSDGRVVLLELEYSTSRFTDPETLPAELRQLSPTDVVTWNRSVVQMTPQGQLRRQQLLVRQGAEFQAGEGAVVWVDYVPDPRGGRIAAGWADGRVRLGELRLRKNILTDEVERSVQWHELSAEDGRQQPPRWGVLLGAAADNLCLIWPDGRLERYGLRGGRATLVERLALATSRDGPPVSALALAPGRETLLVGDRAGRLRAWFRVRRPEAATSDGQWLLPAHTLELGPAPIEALGTSQRSRLAVAALADGRLSLLNVTTEGRLARGSTQPLRGVRLAGLAPRDDAIYLANDEHCQFAALDPGYPEATATALMGPVWYEGYPGPELVWQSSSSGVSSEMKLSLRPLIFGTLKATVYSMLFGAPIALLAAIYTSEFLSARVRSRLKSTIEMMASLPSVVLGFMAALVIAPLIKDYVPGTLCAIATVPLALLTGAFLWQLLPQRRALALSRFRLSLIFLAAALGVAAGVWCGPLVERWLFAGDMMLWLDGQQGTGTGAWMFLLLPLSGLAVALFYSWLINPLLASRGAGWSRFAFAAVNLGKWLLGVLAAFAVALLASWLLVRAGWDPRGSVVGTYDQRNALIVGFVMGFAIIPIIYTIAEDALATVPRELRSASLGAGATPWQTAIRIVIPTAMSGLFSALMIGLGRAVGETMIVLMAAGNTPVMDWNLFNGFRTLSANIATELPEAVPGSTHYRTLFLAALSLFLLTFVVNTIAELVRLRFRSRAVQL